jgi:L-alanine-DL-glutamate epimerase-like enolase superfamily enzyme
MLRLEDGLMTIPKGAGWGIDPDLEAIERHIVTTQKLTPSTILP